jgi:DNA-directed RNA polymerase subunit E'/Rpb7
MSINYQDINLVSPFRNLLQYTRIQILPHMMNSDIINNMEIVLQKKVEGKCNRIGFIDKVHGIELYEETIMEPEKLNGAANYNITYHCRICMPVDNTIIIGVVKAINQDLIIVTNGPIIIFIPKINIDSNIWDISNDFTNKNTKVILKINVHVKILIEKTKINQNDIQIKCIGRLLEVANEEEVSKYFGSIPIESNFIL